MNAAFQRLEGSVSSLSISPGQQQFLRDHERLAGAAVGAGLAASGLAGAAVAAAASSTTPGDSVEHFSCQIDDAHVAGAFSKVTFKDGEKVIAVVERLQNDGWVARAIVRPGDSMVWIEPHCSRGTAAHLAYSLRIGLWVVLGFVVVSLPLLWRLSGDDAKSSERVTFFAVIYGGVALIAGAYYAIRFYMQWRRVANRAENIFRCLGFPDPAAVSLPRENAKCSRALAISWPYETDGPWIYRCDLEGRAFGKK